MNTLTKIQQHVHIPEKRTIATHRIWLPPDPGRPGYCVDVPIDQAPSLPVVYINSDGTITNA